MYHVDNGLATLDPGSVAILRTLERGIVSWAQGCNAPEYAYPVLMKVNDLSRIDYFQNFPHLAVVATGIKEDVLAPEYATSGALETVPTAHMKDAGYVIPSAACYNIYFSLQNTVQPEPVYVTTVARCCRNEAEYVGLERLWAFQMREIVCVGDKDATQAHLKAFRARLEAFAAKLGLPLAIQTATDPFFDRNSSRAKMQTLFPVKEEFVYGGKVAIASVNYHRNFFGERCGIRDGAGEFTHSSCVAFGLERWLHALTDHFGSDSELICAQLERAFSAQPVAV